ncbi:MAG: TraK family protein [Deltaproteobacteria bacterium]|jgi:hypothetical protein|nr:TraK family protein [Deltaproteobacteria bacterium]
MGNYDFEALKSLEQKSLAKMEFLAVEEDVRAFLARGFSKSTVHKHLTAQGALPC